MMVRVMFQFIIPTAGDDKGVLRRKRRMAASWAAEEGHHGGRRASFAAPEDCDAECTFGSRRASCRERPVVPDAEPVLAHFRRWIYAIRKLGIGVGAVLSPHVALWLRTALGEDTVDQNRGSRPTMDALSHTPADLAHGRRNLSLMRSTA